MVQPCASFGFDCRRSASFVDVGFDLFLRSFRRCAEACGRRRTDRSRIRR